LDWDRDGVVDTRQDNSNFDKNGNSIADWLEGSTDQNWVYNGNTGWDDVATLKANQVYGPSAEDIRAMYNMVAQGQAEQYNSWGVPNSGFMNNIAYAVREFGGDQDMNGNTSPLEQILNPSGVKYEWKVPAKKPIKTYKNIEEMFELDDYFTRPIKVTVNENTVKITAYIEYVGLSNELYPGTWARDSKGNIIGGKTYAQVATEGILKIWNANNLGGNHFDFNGIKVNVITEIINKDDYTGRYNRFMRINLSDEEGGGVTKGTESIGRNPRIFLTSDAGDIDVSRFGRVAAHEFGHALGIGDAYDDEDKNRLDAIENSEVPGNDIMRGSINGSIITANDVEMVLRAWDTGYRQDFTDHSYGFLGIFDRHKSEVIRAK
jgi:hypothetical protein